LEMKELWAVRSLATGLATSAWGKSCYLCVCLASNCTGFVIGRIIRSELMAWKGSHRNKSEARDENREEREIALGDSYLPFMSHIDMLVVRKTVYILLTLERNWKRVPQGPHIVAAIGGLVDWF
jgi:hypothetical protein